MICLDSDPKSTGKVSVLPWLRFLEDWLKWGAISQQEPQPGGTAVTPVSRHWITGSCPGPEQTKGEHSAQAASSAARRHIVKDKNLPITLSGNFCSGPWLLLEFWWWPCKTVTGFLLWLSDTVLDPSTKTENPAWLQDKAPARNFEHRKQHFLLAIAFFYSPILHCCL